MNKTIAARFPNKPTEGNMRYLRMYIGGENGEPGITLYEIDKRGWTHRQVQIHADGLRFSPEDIFMNQPTNADYMALHPACEEISHEDFERLWSEVDEGRPFRRAVPDTELAWQGTLGSLVLRWLPDATRLPGNGWTLVPGFTRLYVCGDTSASWRAYRTVFLDQDIDWVELQLGAC